MSLRTPSLGGRPRPVSAGGRLWVGPDGRILRAEQAACVVLGRSVDDVEGRPLRDLLGPRTPRDEGEGDLLVPDLSDAWTHAPDGTAVPLLVGVGTDPDGLVLHLRDGTARHEAQRRVRRSEEQLRRAQSIAHIGSWTWDVVHDDFTCSREFYDIAGIDVTFDAHYDTLMELVHPDERDQLARTVQDVIEARGTFAERRRIVRPDGTLRHVFIQGTAEGGDEPRLYGVVQDITEQVLASQRFEAMLETAPDAMVVVGDDGIIRFANQEAKRIFGYRRDEMVGQAVELLMPEGVRARHVDHRSAYNEAPARRPMGGNMDLIARRKDGTEFPAEISLSPMETEEGTVVTAAIRDVTERRQAEEEARDRRARIESLLANAMDAVILTDLDGRVVEWNPAAERMFGRDAASAQGERFQDFAMPPEAQARFRGILGAARDGLAREHQVWEADLSGANGTVPVEASLARVESGDHTYLLAVVRDITERRKAEESDRLAFERLIEIQQLREVNRFKTILLNTASHELNTPMTPLRLQLHLLESGRLGQLSDRQKHAVEVLQRNVERLSMLIQDVLDVARLESGKLKMIQEPLPVASVVQEAMDTFDQAIAKARLEVDLKMDEELQVRADHNRLVQVLVNLVSNAVKFSPEGGRLRVRATQTHAGDPGDDGASEAGGATDADDHDVIVQVTDDGPGLEPEQIANLFQPFSQVHDQRQTNVPGTGLGLYICKGIIEQHGGSIGVESPGTGKGSTFWFRLPMHHEDAGPA